MAINSYGDNLATNGVVNTSTATAADKTKLGKDDFMQLLLVELQHQDPTEPMDSEKILTQTSQLATLESAENTNNALADLAASIGNSQQFSTIAAIGKMADVGSDAITYDEGGQSNFEMYFPEDVQQGTITISDSEGQTIQTIDVGTNPAGTYQFTWDGTTSTGGMADSGIYHVNATYKNSNDEPRTTRIGAYPIESVRFDGGEAQVRLGSNYVPLSQIREVY